MEISFDDPDFRKMCENDRELRRKCSLARARKIQLRIAALRAAETLEDMRYQPGHCHELTTDRKGSLSLDLDGPYRLLFRPAEQTDPGPGGGLDWTKVTAVVVESVDNTHE